MERRDAHDRELTRFRFPRQRVEPYLCIADFFRPYSRVRASSTTPPSTSSRWAARSREATAKLFAENRYQDYLMLHGLGVEMAEALAELWHKRIREEWGFVDEDGPTTRAACSASSTGAGATRGAIRRAPTSRTTPRWPRCSSAERLGIEVSEETGWQYQPEQTTSAIICHHPRAKYFVAR